jgi:cyanophycin synthetase
MPKLNASSRIMNEEALRRGYQVEAFNDPHLLRITNQGVTWFTRGTRHSKQSSVGMTIADYKSLTRQVVTRWEPRLMAEGEVFYNRGEGLDYADKLGYPLVFKPSAGRHGKGVVVGVRSRDELSEIIGDKVDYRGYILEKLLVGNDYRVVVIDYRFVAATQRVPAFVVGNGESTIGWLVEQENLNPNRGEGHAANLTRITIDKLVEAYLTEQHLSVTSVPAKDQRVYLRKTAGLSTGGVGIDVTDEVSVENRQLFEEVAKKCDLNTVGIDVMAQTLKEPILNDPHAGILELNSSPGLRMHHYPYQGVPRNVAGAILDLLFGGK